MGQIVDAIFFMFYGSAAMFSLSACCYLLFRQGKAFAPDIKPPQRLCRWTAAFFASITLSHLWYLPIYFQSSPDDLMLYDLIGGLLDCITVLPISIAVMFTTLQDRRRPLWPICVIAAPLVIALALCISRRSNDLLPLVYGYFLLMVAALIIYMTVEVRRYGRWLRDNYADLEHKEVWQSFAVLIVIMFGFSIYIFEIGGPLYEFVIQMIDITLVCYLLWRVETLSDLTINMNETEEDADTAEPSGDNDTSLSIRNHISPLLEQYCERPQLYLQYDISLSELARRIGTNRSYLSKHFAAQGITYNTYINGLRIRHFISLYQEAARTHQPATAQQLAHKSGFRSYSTFSAAFKQLKRVTPTEWMQHSES